ncbi:diaminopropionate ammonia-lyase [Feifania hominis]|uniref:diaminopropionate ammonia-lyase n=1 Tax=Feifania hominis TaxID=2763660 RepID=UPI00201685D7
MNAINSTRYQPTGEKADVSAFSPDVARRVREYHESFPMYEPTPLANLPALAKRLGVGSIMVKDESKRFGLNAFKVLGGSYAIGSLIAQRLGLSELSWDALQAARRRGALDGMTFITATDGNHGRGVAWTAGQLGCRAIVYMPRGSAAERLENIRATGAEACILDLPYDDVVRRAAAEACENGWTLVQDTAFDGYEEIPKRIMQGYLTMGEELAQQLRDEPPTHVFVQSGVGSFPAALTAWFAARYGERRPTVVTVEPHTADCVFRTAQANDGSRHFVTGEMKTISAGLACGEPNPLAWEILKSFGEYYLSIPDEITMRAMRILGNPMPGDCRVVSGESGAAGFAAAVEILENSAYAPLRRAMGLDSRAKILCISTEGDTDRENYRRIVWG